MKAVPWQWFPGNGAMATALWQRESAKGMWGDVQGDVGGCSWRQRDHGIPQGWDTLPKPGPPAALVAQSRGITGAFLGVCGAPNPSWVPESGKMILGPPSSSGTSSTDKEQGEGAGTWGMTPWELPAAVPRPGAGPTHTCEQTHTPVHAPLLCFGSPALSSPADAAVSHHHKGSP